MILRSSRVLVLELDLGSEALAPDLTAVGRSEGCFPLLRTANRFGCGTIGNIGSAGFVSERRRPWRDSGRVL